MGFSSLNPHADVAQLVEHHLAKVRVAGSNPVVRSKRTRMPRVASCGGVAERRGSGLQSRVHGFKSRLHLDKLYYMVDWRSWLARFLDMEEVTGSSPVSTTKNSYPSRLRALNLDSARKYFFRYPPRFISAENSSSNGLPLYANGISKSYIRSIKTTQRKAFA